MDLVREAISAKVMKCLEIYLGEFQGAFQGKTRNEREKVRVGSNHIFLWGNLLNVMAENGFGKV
ncbi:hypothetical protein OH492_13090 [Vibrio chagasii]|nr:hypothetical protein [Vibrio chagasii]